MYFFKTQYLKYSFSNKPPTRLSLQQMQDPQGSAVQRLVMAGIFHSKLYFLVFRLFNFKQQ